MITLIDIQDSITLKLKNNFMDHTVYLEENKAEIKTPAFYIDVIPLLTDQFTKYKNKLVNVDIMYFSRKNTRRENLIMEEKLENIFYLILRVKERRLHIKKLNIKEANNILHCNFTLDFNTDVNIKYDIENDRDLGYTEGNVEYMKTLHAKDAEGNEV